MFISKKKYLFLVRCINHYKIFSDAYRFRVDIDRKKIDELNSKFQHMRQSKIFWKNRCRELEEKLRDLRYEQLKKTHQDKILFAVEWLEKVKELFLIETKEYPIVYNISDDIVGGAIDKDKIFNIIDNQIEELKGVVS